MRLCHFEQRPETFEPLSLTRPIFELCCGLTTLAEKQRRYFGLDDWGALVRPDLVNLYRLQNPGVAVNDLPWLGGDRLLLVNGRWLPPAGKAPSATEPRVATVDQEIAYLVLSAQQAGQLTLENLPLFLKQQHSLLPERLAAGRLVQYPWDLVEHNGREISVDFEQNFLMGQGADCVHLVGPAAKLWIDSTAKIDPLVVADTSGGPIVVAEQAVISAFTRLEGPCYVGPGTHVLGAKIRAGTTLGPNCRVGGEVEASILHGHSNKYHEGFLGHSYLGEWVNLGAGTHNSDLRNDYGEVTMTVAGQSIATGQTKIGCFLGDHTKTGLGTLLNTGTSAGVFCNLLPSGGFAPNHVPSFLTWWKGALRNGFPLERLLQTARQVMKRRGAFLTSEHVVLYHKLWDETALERRRALADAPAKTLRKTG